MAHEFNIKNGFITSGQSYVYQNLTVSGLTISAVPANDDTLTQILARDSSGNVKYRTASSLGGGGTTGAYLPLSGGTVSGNTYFTSGLSANTLFVSGLTRTSGLTSTGGIIFPQKTINSSYTALTTDYMIDVTGGTFNVQLPTAVGVQGKLLCVKNNGGGAVTVYPYGTETIDEKPLIILSETNAIQLVSNGSYWVILGQDRSTINNSTGVFVFTGMSKVSATQFSVAPVRGWITDATSNPLSPQIFYVYFSGGTYTDNFISTATETFVYLTSGGTIQQQATPLTEQERRQNIFLGKIGHPDKTSINLVFSQPDYVMSPLAQLRDMFVPINLINGGVYPSTNGANLKFNTSAGYLYGLGINFAVDTLSPNTIYVSGNNPATFQYRTQTGGTTSNVTDIDPTKYDVNGVLTPVTGVKATNQRIYLLQNGTIRVQYGQTTYNQLSAAIAGIQTETFVVFPNWINNAILIGILSVLSSATDLTDTTKAKFFLVSKFGETVGAAGGVSTTNLQQAYNNSTSPEIIINSTLDGLSIKNGTGNDDNVSNLLEGVNSSGTTTSFIRADGLISGLTVSTPGFTANTNGLTSTTVSATTYYNLPSQVAGSQYYVQYNNGTTFGADQTFTWDYTKYNLLNGFNSSIVNNVNYSAVVGGQSNTLNNPAGAINFNNNAIIGGSSNSMSNTNPEPTFESNVILGGSANDITEVNDPTSPKVVVYNSIIGGYDLHISDSYNSTLIGGESNSIRGFNQVPTYANTIIGGDGHQIYNTNPSIILAANAIIGGEGNSIYESNNVGTYFNIIGGGDSNVIFDSLRSGIIAGSANTIRGNSSYSSIIGGDGNTILGYNRSVILGGANITASADDFVYVPSLAINTTPVNDDTLTQVLVRDTNFGVVKYRNASSLGGGGSTPFTGGTVTGETNFTAGLTANTISATTYVNLPIDIRVTGGTFSAGTATFRNNTGGTFTVTGFSTSTATSFTGGTVTGATNFTGGLTANTISATTYVNLPVSGLTQGTNITITNNGQGNFTISSTGGGGSFTGGTVSGGTTFISGVTANTLIYSVVTLTSGATISVNAVLGNEFKVTLGGNSVLGNPTGAVDGQYLRFAIRQDASGNRNLTFDTKYRFGNEIGTPSVDLTANKTSYLGVRYNIADDRFDVISFVSGY